MFSAKNVQSAALVRQVVPALIEEGYKFARLDEMPEYRQYETPVAPHGVADARPATIRVAFAPDAVK